MTRRIFRTNRVLLSRRVVEMMTSLFRRRFGFAPARCSRRGRGRGRAGLVGWVTDVTQSFMGDVDRACVMSTGMIRSALLSRPSLEQLESRKMFAGMDWNQDGQQTLAVWINDANESLEVWSTSAGRITVQSSTDGLVFDSTLRNDTPFNILGTTHIPTKLMVYEEQLFPTATVSLATTQAAGFAIRNFGGSGYTTSPAVDLSRQEGGSLATYGQAAIGETFLAVNSITGTPTGTGLPAGAFTITYQQKNASGAVVDSGTVLYDPAATTKFSNYSTGGTWDFTDLTNLSFTTGGTAVTGLTATGRVDRFEIENFSGTHNGIRRYDGYYGDVLATFSGGGGAGATRYVNLSADPLVSGSTTEVTFGPPVGVFISNPIQQEIYVGTSEVWNSYVNGTAYHDREQSISIVTVDSPITTLSGRDVVIRDVGSYEQLGSITTGGSADFIIDNYYRGGDSVLVKGNITAGRNVQFALTTGGDLTFTAGDLVAGGSISIFEGGGGRIDTLSSVGRSFDANGGSINVWADTIDITLAENDPIEARNGVFLLGGGSIEVSGSGYIESELDSVFVRDFVGGIAIDAQSISAADDVDIYGEGTVQLDAPVSGPSYFRAVSNNSFLNITERVESSGAVYLQSKENMTLDATLVGQTSVVLLSDDQINGLPTVVADRLTISAAQASGVTMNTSVNVLSSTTDGTVSITNSKSLTTEGLNLLSGGDLTIAVQGKTSDLTIGTSINHTGGNVTLTAGRNLFASVLVNSTGDVFLNATVGSVEATSVNTAGNLSVTANAGIDLSGSVKADAFRLYTNTGNISLRAPSSGGTVKVSEARTSFGNIFLTATSGDLVIQDEVASQAGNISLVSVLGGIDVEANANIATATDRSVTVSAKNAVDFNATASLSTGTLDYSSSNGSLMLQSGASFHTLTADVTGANNDLVVVQAADLNLAGITTMNGDVDVTLTAGNLTVSGGIDAGTGDVVFDVQQGGISAPASIDGDQLTSDSNLTATYDDLNVATLVASVSAAGEDLTVVNAGDLAIGAGNVSVNNGAASIKLTDGDLTRTGGINAAGGSLLIDVGDKSILSTGAISTNRLEWIAKAAPSETNLAYSVLDATMTAAGDLVIARAAPLTIDGITLADGNVNISVASGDLTLNGSVASSGNLADITLNAATGGIVFQAGTLVADNLSLTADDDIDASINAATLVAQSTNGSVTVTETDGLEILAAGVSAAENASITLSAGNLVLTGSITAGLTASDKVVLDVAGGTISGSGLVTVTNGSLYWTALEAPDDTQLFYTNLSAALTGAGQNLVITRTTDLNLLGASTVDGDISIDADSQTLTVLGNITAGNSGDINITADSITVAPTFVITGGALSVSASNTSALRVAVDSLEADIAANASLSVEALSNLEIAANGVSLLNGAIDIEVVAGNLTLTGNLTAGGNNVSLDVAGDILDNGGQVLGDVLNFAVVGNATLDTEVNQVVGSVNGSLALVEVDGLEIGAGGIFAGTDLSIDVVLGDFKANAALSAGGDIDITSQVGNISGTGSLTAGDDITLSAVAGSVTFDSAAGQITGDLLAITANGPVSVNTNVSLLDAEITGAGATLDVDEVDSVTVIVGGLETENGDINLTTGGNLTIAGAVDAGTANVTLDVTRSIDGAGLITAGTLNVASNATIDAAVNTDVDDLVADISGSLTVTEADAINATVTATSVDLTAGGDANLTTTIGALVADITGDLTVVETDDLDIGAGDVVATGDISLTLSGNLAGAGNIAADGNVTLNATGTIVLNGTEQISGDLLDVTAGGDTELGTNVATLVADITGNLTVVEAGNLLIGAGNVTATGDISLDLDGSLSGPGLIDAGAEDVTIVAADTITLNAADQITGNVLAITAGNSVDIGTNVAILTAIVASGDLEIVEADDLVIEVEATASTGDVSIELGGNLSGDGSLVAAGNVTLDAVGDIAFNAAGQISGSLLDLTAGGEADVGTDVTTLVANVTGNLTVAESDGLAIGAAGVESQAGNISLDLAGGSLTGTGDVVANNAVSIVLQGSGNIALTTGQIQAEEISVATQGTGDVAINTAVANITATVLDGSLVVTEADDLRVVGITAENGAIEVTLTSGDLTIDSGSILGGQLSDVTLDVSAGSITSVDDADAGNYGVVTGHNLVITAQNTSTINTSVTALTGQVIGAGEDLTITEQDGAGYNGAVTIDGDNLAIAAAGLSANGGDITITMLAPPANVSSGGFVLDGNISTTGDVTLNIASGGITSTDASGFIAANVATLLAVDDVSVFTDATTLVANITGAGNSLFIDETDNLIIGAGGVVTDGGDITIRTRGGSLTITGEIDATTAANVTLDVTGAISGTGLITADELEIDATSSASIKTDIASLDAHVFGSLTVTEVDDLGITSVLAGDDVSLTLLTGNLTGPGPIVAGDDITLDVAAGAITLTDSSGQVEGDLLDITARDSSAIKTKVATLVAKITGAGETLTITEVDALTIGASDVVTNAGEISITTGGLLTVTGDINTNGATNVVLDVTGSIAGTGLITADELDITATGSATIKTDIASLNADVGGSLTVTEVDDLGITRVLADDDVSLTLLTGNLTGPGPIVAADDITLNVAAGAITLTKFSGQVQGDLLTIKAQDSSNIKTNVGSLAAEVTTDGASLDVVEVNALTIAAGDVSVTNGTINITTGGSLTLTGDIDARTTGNVTLVSDAAVTSAGGSVLADLLDLRAVSTSSVATTVNNLTAKITGSSSQGLTINETDGLTVTASGVETTGGPIQIRATGHLDIEGDVKSATGTVTLTATNGGITTAGAEIIANRLVLTAKNNSAIDTTISFLNAQITGLGESLSVDETNALIIDASGVVTNNGDVVLNIGTPTRAALTLTSGIAAGSSGDVTVTGRSVTGAGLVTADTLLLDLTATSSVKTSVNTIQGVVTSGYLTVSESNDLAIGADDLVASGNGGRIVITTGGVGNLTGPGDIVASTGLSQITLTVGGDATMAGKVTAGAVGRVTLIADGNVSMNASEQITGQQLTLTAAGNVDIGTKIAALSATVTGSTKTLTVTEYDGFTVLPNTAKTTNGSIHLITGDVAAGDMVITGPVNAGTANVLLESQDGSIVTTGAGLITGNNLTVEAVDGSVDIDTSVNGLAASLATNGETLTVVEANGLQILAGNITTNDGDVDLTLTAGSLTINGEINATTAANVTLDVTGAISGNGLITADELTINALGAVNVQTDVSNIAVTTTGPGLAVTVNDSGTLAIDGIDTNNGSVSVTAAGDIEGAGDIDAGTGAVTLIADNINVTGLVTGNALSLDVATDANLTTSVNSLEGSVDGTLDLVESAGLVIAAAGVNGGDLNIKVLDGSLTGTGVINAPGKAVSLTADKGPIQLASKVGQIVADSLHVSAKTSALVNTNVNTLTADQAGTLTVTEVDGLAIGAAGLDTSAGNGDVSLTVSKGNLNGPGGIVAGTGDIKISVPLGAVTLTGDSVAGDLLTVIARTGANLKTDVNSADVQVTSAGGVTISEADDLTMVRAIAAVAGDVSITLTGPGDLTLQTVTATGAAPNGDVVLATNDGDAFINGKLSASQKLDVSKVNGQVVLGKSGTITTGKAANSIVQGGGAIEVVVDSRVASVALNTGSLGSAITRINGLSVGTRAEIIIDSPLEVSVTSALPTINRETDILGNGMLTLTASPAGNTFNGLALNASGSSIDGVTFKNFGGAAINLIGGTTLAAARVMTVTDVVIENSRIGLQATNFFTGGSRFGGNGDTSLIDGKNRVGSSGVLLSNARGFLVRDVDIARAHIGISIAGKSEGTVVTQNRISGREDVTTGYGISLANATGLSGNSLTVSQNQIDQFLNGVFASGYCTFTTVSGTTFNDLSFDTNISGISSANRYNVSRSRNLTVLN